MTNEELKNMLFIIDTLLDDAITDSTRQKVKDTLTEVCQLAMKALEQQPSEDCISRQAVLDVINFEDEWLFDAKSHNADTKIAFSAIKSKISELPSVTPRRDLAETSQDCISREAVLNGLANIAKAKAKSDAQKALMGRVMFFTEQLPSVTPERPKGKWIKIQSGDEDFPESIVCSRCKNENSHLDFDEHNNVIGKVFVTSKYCPNCGAEMSGGGEDEVSD